MSAVVVIVVASIKVPPNCQVVVVLLPSAEEVTVVIPLLDCMYLIVPLLSINLIEGPAESS